MLIMKKRSQVEILRKIILDTGWTLQPLSWETRGEQGHILGSYMCDMCPAILQVTNPFIIYSHLSFRHVEQDTCHTYKNLVYDLAHHESPRAQWLERPTSIWKVMGSTPVGDSENSFSEYFDLRTLLHYETLPCHCLSLP